MPAEHLALGLILAGVMAALGVWTLYRQRRQLASLTENAAEDQPHLRRQARRRSLCGVLLLLLALMQVVALCFLEQRAQRLADEGPAVLDRPADRQFLRWYGLFWIGYLLLLLLLILLAGKDLWATRRHGLEQFRRLREARRAMIEEQTENLRRRRQPPSGQGLSSW